MSKRQAVCFSRARKGSTAGDDNNEASETEECGRRRGFGHGGSRGGPDNGCAPAGKSSPGARNAEAREGHIRPDIGAGDYGGRRKGFRTVAITVANAPVGTGNERRVRQLFRPTQLPG
jgi:hypothetical protein